MLQPPGQLHHPQAATQVYPHKTHMQTHRDGCDACVCTHTYKHIYTYTHVHTHTHCPDPRPPLPLRQSPCFLHLIFILRLLMKSAHVKCNMDPFFLHRNAGERGIHLWKYPLPALWQSMTSSTDQWQATKDFIHIL